MPTLTIYYIIINYKYWIFFSVSLKFGVITMLSGILGVPAGSALAQYLRPRYPRIDPLICAGGLLLSTPFFFASLLLANINSELCFTCIFFGELFLNLNWSIVADILLVSNLIS